MKTAKTKAADARRTAAAAPKKQRTRPKAAPKVGFVSLGCPKALVDSERILTQLRTDGYEIVPTYDDADVVVVNHHLFFADVALKDTGVAELLPTANTIIFDEAHNVVS